MSAIMGYDVIGTDLDTTRTGNYAVRQVQNKALLVTAPIDGVITFVRAHVYKDAAVGATPLSMAIALYDSILVGGIPQPNTLLAQSNLQTITATDPADPNWVEWTLSTSVPVTVGTTYFIAIRAETTSTVYYPAYLSGDNIIEYNLRTGNDNSSTDPANPGFRTTWSVVGAWHANVSIYAVVESTATTTLTISEESPVGSGNVYDFTAHLLPPGVYTYTQGEDCLRDATDTCVSTGSGTFVLVATPTSGYRFSHWVTNDDNNNSTNASIAVVMDANCTVQAIFSAELAPPSIDTNSATSVGVNAATLNGIILNDGGEACTVAGFELSADGGMTYADVTPFLSGSWTSDATFSQTLSGLAESTTYWYRAKASNPTNGWNTAPANAMSFTTATSTSQPMGVTTIGSSVYPFGGQGILTWAQSAIAPVDGHVQRLHLHVVRNQFCAIPVAVAMALYDGTTQPLVLLAQSTTPVDLPTSSAAWITVDLDVPVHVTPGTTYWLAFRFVHTTYTGQVADVSYTVITNTFHEGDCTISSFPTNWTEHYGINNALLSIYADVEPPAPAEPTVETNAVTAWTWTAPVTATLNGTVVSINRSAVTKRGFYISPNPGIPNATTLEVSETSASFPAEPYTLVASGLTAYVPYYYRAFAQNGIGIGFGDELTFEIKEIFAPTVTTIGHANVTNVSATLTGHIASQGNAMVCDQIGFDLFDGISWSTITSPLGEYYEGQDFTLDVTSLRDNTTYQYRARAHNSTGWGIDITTPYKTFTTEPTPVNISPSISETRGVLIKDLSVNPHDDNLICDTLVQYGMNTVYLQTDIFSWTGMNIAPMPGMAQACAAHGLSFRVLVTLGWKMDTTYSTEQHEQYYPYGLTGYDPEWAAYDNTGQITIQPTFSSQASRDRIKKVIQTILTVAPETDEIMLDYVRYANIGAMNTNIPYDDASKNEFLVWLTTNGKTFTGNWADYYYGASHWREFAQWRVACIDNLVRDCQIWAKAIKPSVRISAATFVPYGVGWYPDEWNMKGGQAPQDWIDKGYINSITPMNYYNSVSNPPNNTQISVTKEAQYWLGKIPTGAVPLVSFMTYGSGFDTGSGTVTVDAFIQIIDYLRSSGCNGFVLYIYNGPGFGGEMIVDYLAALRDSTVKGAFPTFIQTAPSYSNNVVTWQTSLPTVGAVEYSTTPLFPAQPVSGTAVDYLDINYVAGTFLNNDDVEGTNATTNHTFTIPIPPPFYFRVIDSDGNIELASQTLLAETVVGVRPIAVIAPQYVTVRQDETIPFDGTGSYDPDGEVREWYWDFGDGTSLSQSQPTKSYSSVGTYVVTLRVVDDQGNWSLGATTVITVNPKGVVADADGPYVAHITTPTIDFLGSNAGGDTVVLWEWNFGDGGTSTSQNPRYTYQAVAATYTVTLRVVGETSESTDTAQVTITPYQPPIAAFSWLPTDPPPFAGQAVTFASTSQPVEPGATIVSEVWNFQDGSPSSQGHMVTHAFPVAGIYAVSLAVTDSIGTLNIVIHDITVTTPIQWMTGTIVDADGNAIKDVYVHTMVQTTTHWTLSKADGYFSIPLPATGLYTLTFQKDGYQTATIEAASAVGEVSIGTVTLALSTSTSVTLMAGLGLLGLLGAVGFYALTRRKKR